MKLKSLVFLGMGLVFLFVGTGLAADTCNVARDVAEKAAEAYRKDRKRGIDLFLKAYRLRPDDGAFAYNAGMAYYGDGNLARAQRYLEMAVQKPGARALWHNNLASVMLERGNQAKMALSHAQKAAKRDPDSPAIQETLANAHAAAGPLFKKISPGMLKSKQPVRRMAKGSVFCGADKDQVCAWYPAKRHSLFTYFFLKGLGGSADKNGDRTITTGEMKAYLEDEVPYWAGREANRKQNPLVTGDGDAVLTRLK